MLLESSLPHLEIQPALSPLAVRPVVFGLLVRPSEPAGQSVRPHRQDGLLATLLEHYQLEYRRLEGVGLSIVV